MKRRGGGGPAAGAEPSAQQRNVADVDDRQMSAEAQQRARRKAEAEVSGGRSASAAASTPAMPLGFVIGAAALLGLMVYLTIKFS
jgi:hypothetical protein